MKFVLIPFILFFSYHSLAARFNTAVGNFNDKKIPKEWKDLLDPNNTRFWKEGNHIPDEGFLLFAKNPENLEYAKYWLLRNEIKSQYLLKMQKTVETAQRELFLAGKLKDHYFQFKNEKKRNFSPSINKSDLKKLNYFFIYSSTCSHCKNLATKLVQLPEVISLQADNKKIVSFKGLKPSSRATAETLNNYAPDGQVPVVVIHNPINNAATKIVGDRPIDEYLFASMELLKKGNNE